MASFSNTHPEKEQLLAFSLGTLVEVEAEHIADHLDRCSDCSETIVNFQDDTFVNLVRSTPTENEGRTAAINALDNALERSEDVDQATSLVPCEKLTTDAPQALREHRRYQIVKLIGQGGMGKVYKARHRMLDRQVAIKVIDQALVQKAEAVERFHLEMKTVAQLTHANIVAAYDAEQVDNVHFMAMEYVDGIDLAEFVRERGPLRTDVACDYVQQAAVGLQYAHELGMVHRDIKPHNLMITDDGVVKILDFGLASFAQKALPETGGTTIHAHLTMAGSIMGTPDFISPEQASDARSADIRSDIYSLGMTPYFLLSGRPPFGEDSIRGKLNSHAHKEPASLTRFRDDVSTELAALISKMVAKNSEQRFQSPQEVADALVPFAQSADWSTASKSSIQKSILQKPVLPWSRKFSWIATATLILMAVVASVVFYVQTDNGLIRVEVMDESLDVVVKGQDIVLNDDENPLTIRAGKHQLIIRQDNSDFEFLTATFQIRRNEQVTFKVQMIDGRVDVRKDGRQFADRELPKAVQAAENYNRESEQLQSARLALDESLKRYGSGHMKVTGLENRIKSLEDSVRQGYSDLGANARAQLAVLEYRYGRRHPSVQAQLQKIKALESNEKQNNADQLKTARNTLAELQSKFRDEHPAVQGQQNVVQELQRQSMLARIRRAAVEIQNLEQALQMYKLNFGQFPSTAEGLRALLEKPAKAPLVRALPKDPWGNDYRYEFPNTHQGDNAPVPLIWSPGPDGLDHTDDDVTGR